MSLLSEVIVQGARGFGGSSLSKILGQSVGSALGSGRFGALTAGPGGGASTQQLQDAVNSASQRYGFEDTTVAPVEVKAPPPPAPGGALPGGALGSVLSQVMPTAPSAVGSGPPPNTVAEVQVNAPAPAAPAASGALSQALGQALGTSVEGLDVVAPKRDRGPVVDPAPFAAPVAAQLATIGNPSIEPPPVITEEPKEPLTAEQIALISALPAVAGLMQGGPSGNITPAGEGGPGGGGLPGGLGLKDLIAAGLLGAGLLTGGGGGGGNKDALKDLAQFNQQTAGRLANIAEAGFQGKIGGNAMNSIQRMVRKAQAAIRQRYAGMGMTGTTAERDDLNDAVEAGVEQQFEIGQKMAATGLNAIAALTGQSAQAYLALMNAQTAKDTALGNALANFAGAFAR